MPPRPRRRSRRLAIAVAAAAAGAVAAAVLLLPPSGQAPGQPTRRPAGDGRVPSRAAGAAVPQVSTAGWRAVLLDGAAVPSSPAAGPARVSGGVASGYADTPAGAVLAACGTAVRVSGQLGPAVFVPTISRQVTGPAAAVTALLAAAWQEYGQASAQDAPRSPGGPAGPLTAVVTAFRLTAWTPAAASVTFTVTASGGPGEQATVPVQVRWSGGDWRLVAPAGGAFPAAASLPGVPPGFTPLPSGR